LISARASVLVMTFSAAALGGLLAQLSTVRFDGLAWLGCLIGLLLAHAANNQLNDLTDSARGIDEGNYFRTQYGAHVLEDGLLSRKALWRYIGITGGLALSIGLWLVARVGVAVIPPLLLGGLFLVFYTWPLKHWSLGELAVLLVWGPLMTGGTYLVSTGSWSWEVAVVGTVFALGPTTVIFGKHIDKLPFDQAKGVTTLPVRLGAKRSRRCVHVMVIMQYLVTGALVISGALPWPVVAIALALPKAWRMLRVYNHEPPKECPPEFPETAWPLWYVAFAFDHTRAFGLLFLLGLCAAVLLD
jgi:1,4-dihydroxy-2-naphthoate octaprenyltransferase